MTDRNRNKADALAEFSGRLEAKAESGAVDSEIVEAFNETLDANGVESAVIRVTPDK